MVKLTIDGKAVEVEENTTILDAARSVGIEIPTLCYLRELNEIGSCRVCVVEIDGIDQLVASCNNYVLDGMVVYTNSPKVRIARKANVELLLSQHDSECTSCVRSGNCTLQTVANDLGIVMQPYAKHLPGQPDIGLENVAQQGILSGVVEGLPVKVLIRLQNQQQLLQLDLAVSFSGQADGFLQILLIDPGDQIIFVPEMVVKCGPLRAADPAQLLNPHGRQLFVHQQALQGIGEGLLGAVFDCHDLPSFFSILLQKF
jgi:aerobic-type carbon monoxide dehydrogenase small subunit (CoxS/CutS family)